MTGAEIILKAILAATPVEELPQVVKAIERGITLLATLPADAADKGDINPSATHSPAVDKGAEQHSSEPDGDHPNRRI